MSERWWDDAACREHPRPEIFEQPHKPKGRVPRGGRVLDDSWADEALTLCSACPVKLQCLDEHLKYRREDDFQYSAPLVVGGMLPREVNRLARRTA